MKSSANIGIGGTIIQKPGAEQEIDTRNMKVENRMGN
jgi:hypothetical protein